ncbi:MAG TPA: ketoisovalerate oxidoreductase [Peptococcaceae bacterium]|nr:MAG: Pyruvate/ketoisovalerate oxidoreductase [Clostridia bacterium 41_269]HBT19765.1 ketoisovalerate oxidoreductase [Peptococcaceae bacterium]
MSKGAKIVIAGEGGQGVQTIANMLSEAAYEEGREALYIPNFGVEQRGGVSVAYIQISDEPIGSPKFKDADVAVALSKRSIRRIAKYCDKETIFLYEGEITDAEGEFPEECREIIKVPAIKIAKELFHPKVFNVIIMGFIIGLTNVVSVDTVKKIINSQLEYKFEKNPELREMNHKALEKGVELALNR